MVLEDDRARAARRSSSRRACSGSRTTGGRSGRPDQPGARYQASLARGSRPRSCCSARRHREPAPLLNARATIEALLKLGVVPVVNENDTVATNEIRFGDNDRLSARVAVMASADQLILLSGCGRSVPPIRARSRRGAARGGRRDHARRSRPWRGRRLCGRHRRHGEQAGRRTDRDPRRLRGDHRSRVRLAAAVATGRRRPCTFLARATRERARNGSRGAGRDGVVRIDYGRRACAAQRRLPAGVLVGSAFGRGDAVIVRDPDGNDIAKGLCAYDAEDAPDLRAQDRADRGAARLSRPRRADPSRRSGPALSGRTEGQSPKSRLCHEQCPHRQSVFDRSKTKSSQ